MEIDVFWLESKISSQPVRSVVNCKLPNTFDWTYHLCNEAMQLVKGMASIQVGLKQGNLRLFENRLGNSPLMGKSFAGRQLS